MVENFTKEELDKKTIVGSMGILPKEEFYQFIHEIEKKGDNILTEMLNDRSIIDHAHYHFRTVAFSKHNQTFPCNALLLAEKVNSKKYAQEITLKILQGIPKTDHYHQSLGPDLNINQILYSAAKVLITHNIKLEEIVKDQEAPQNKKLRQIIEEINKQVIPEAIQPEEENTNINIELS